MCGWTEGLVDLPEQAQVDLYLLCLPGSLEFGSVDTLDTLECPLRGGCRVALIPFFAGLAKSHVMAKAWYFAVVSSGTDKHILRRYAISVGERALLRNQNFSAVLPFTAIWVMDGEWRASRMLVHLPIDLS